MEIREEAHPSRRGAGRHVLVGYDGSDKGERVLRWAVEEARLRHLPLVVCHAYRWPLPIPPTDKDALHTMARTAKAVVDTGVLIASQLDPRLEVRTRLAMGSASGALLSQSVDADLIVVGSRGGGGFERLLVGAVAAQVAAHALCPTVVVRDASTVLRGQPRSVVVGIDGSPASEAALAFAFEEAALRRGTLRVVCGWWDPAAAPRPPTVPFIDVEELKRQAAARFQRTIAPWLEKYRQVKTKTSFVAEPPREALIRAAAGATLLVVGDHGVGSAPELLLGPVAQAILHHAPCSVAITHALGAR